MKTVEQVYVETRPKSRALYGNGLMARPSWATPLGMKPRARSYSARDFGRVSTYSCSTVFIAHLPWGCDPREDSIIRAPRRHPQRRRALLRRSLQDGPARRPEG